MFHIRMTEWVAEQRESDSGRDQHPGTQERAFPWKKRRFACQGKTCRQKWSRER